MPAEPNDVNTNHAIDADGHVLEPPDLWLNYLEEKYRDRAIRLETDENGLEIFLFDNKPSQLVRPGYAGILGAMGATDILPSVNRSWATVTPTAAFDAKARVAHCDEHGLAAVLLYPTTSLLWEAEVSDPELSIAYARAYNRWLIDMCSEAPNRLYAIAHIPLADVDLAIGELQRAVKAGCKGAMVVPFTWTRKAPGHRYYNKLWAAVQDLDVPVSLHPALEPLQFNPLCRFEELTPKAPIDFIFYFDVLVFQALQQAFVSLFTYGVFEKFPKVKWVLLESQAGWIGHLLDRMDAVWAGPLKATTELKHPPSFYFDRQCWISADPDERALSGLIERIGADKFFWASDYPHPDHTEDFIEHLKELVAPLSRESRDKVMHGNVTEVYKLD